MFNFCFFLSRVAVIVALSGTDNKRSDIVCYASELVYNDNITKLSLQKFINNNIQNLPVFILIYLYEYTQSLGEYTIVKCVLAVF